ncbi:MAG: alkaline phosphatase family protein, partial [Pseudomonadota bacterium]
RVARRRHKADHGSMEDANPERIPPAYDGAGLVNLVASVARGVGADVPAVPAPLLDPERVAGSRVVVFALIDGLGRAAVERHPDSWLARHCAGELTSVFPSTTTSALTTFYTGVPPAAHGLPAWFTWLREAGTVAVPLAHNTRYGHLDLRTAGVLPGPLYTTAPWARQADRPVATCQPGWLQGTPYSRHHSTGRHHDLESPGDLPGLVDRLAGEPGPRLLQVYWPAFDALSHQHGTEGEATRDHFRELDAALAATAAALPEDGLLIVTADHGLIDVADGGLHELSALPELAAMLTVPPCGEGRVPFLYPRAGAIEETRAALTEGLGEAVTAIHTREAIRERGWLGPGPAHPELSPRIGDLVVEMAPGHVLTGDPWRPGIRQRAVHGGLSREEMAIPAIIAGGGDPGGGGP